MDTGSSSLVSHLEVSKVSMISSFLTHLIHIQCDSHYSFNKLDVCSDNQMSIYDVNLQIVYLNVEGKVK